MLFLYFSQGMNSTISIIKTKKTCWFTQECICMEVGTGVRVQSQQMQTSKLNPGIPSLVALYKSREMFRLDSGSGKTSGIIQGALHSWFRKRTHMPWYHFFCIKLDFDSQTNTMFWVEEKEIEEERGKKTTNRRRRKKWTHQCCYLGSSKQRRGSGALGKWMCYLLPRSKLQKLLNCIRMSYRTL